VPRRNVHALYSQEINDSEIFLQNQFGNSLQENGVWEVSTYPLNYISSRIAAIPNIRDILYQAQVNVRGWSFPHVQRNPEHGEYSNHNRGAQSYTSWEDVEEGFRIYLSGLFIWKTIFREDKRGIRTDEGRRVLNYRSVIHNVTEYLFFAKRLYALIAPDEDIYLKISLNNCNNRQLLSLDPATELSSPYVCRETNSIFVEGNYNVIDLSASYKEIARVLIKHIYSIFNWNDPNDSMIESWQARY